MRALLVVALGVTLAGCVQPTVQSVVPLPPGLPAPEMVPFQQQGCKGYFLGLVVDPHLTDPYLPPGFHLRDPRQILPAVPPTSGTGLALVAVIAYLCSPTRDLPEYQEASAMIFVLPPKVAGERANATYDFYEVEHYSADAEVQARLAPWGWPVVNQTLTDTSVGHQVREQEFFLQAGNPDPLALLPNPPPPAPPANPRPALFMFGGATPLPSDTPATLPAPTLLRVWRQFPQAAAYLDYHMQLGLNMGSGSCTFQPGSVLAQLTGVEACGTVQPQPVAGQTGTPQPAIIASFKTDFQAVAVRQRGVAAQ